jgi:large subunit ribosomal protein L29
MKTSELREMPIDKIEEKIAGWEEELFNLRFQAKLGQLANALQLRLLRRDRARAITILGEKRRTTSSERKG